MGEKGSVKCYKQETIEVEKRKKEPRGNEYEPKISRFSHFLHWCGAVFDGLRRAKRVECRHAGDATCDTACHSCNAKAKGNGAAPSHCNVFTNIAADHTCASNGHARGHAHNGRNTATVCARGSNADTAGIVYIADTNADAGEVERLFRDDI